MSVVASSENKKRLSRRAVDNNRWWDAFKTYRLQMW